MQQSAFLVKKSMLSWHAGWPESIDFFTRKADCCILGKRSAFLVKKSMLSWHAGWPAFKNQFLCPSTHARFYRLGNRNKHRRVRLSFRARGDSTSRAPQLRPLGVRRSDGQAYRTFRFTTYGTFLYSLERCRSRRCCAAGNAAHEPRN